jgi:hypothetical protein
MCFNEQGRGIIENETVDTIRSVKFLEDSLPHSYISFKCRPTLQVES